MEPVRKLTAEEIANVAGGRFEFDYDYVLKKKAANLVCPVCGAEGTLNTEITGFDGYADGTRIAVDTCICTSCGVQVDIMPEVCKMRIVPGAESGKPVEIVDFTW